MKQGCLVLGLVALAACGERAPDDARLQAEVDSLVPIIEKVADMRATGPVKAQGRTRDQLREYLSERMTEELPEREMQRLEAAYKELGLLPDTLSLRSLLIDLYTEQVVGYYDPPTRTLYMVSGVPQEAARTVMAHELVHALQDQHVNLDSLISSEIGNDRSSAAQAAVEGQATVVMFALLLQERTNGEQDIARLPDIGEKIRPALEAQNDQYPVFQHAPLIIRETLTFPYFAGADFIQAIWRAHPGARPPFRAMIPASTEQVLHPRTRFIGAPDPPTAVRLAPPPQGWNVLYEDALGELELGVLLRQHLGAGADSAAVGWDGDVVRLMETPLGERVLVLASVWDDAASADRFAAAYRRVLEERHARHGTVQRLEIDGRPVVIATDASTGVPMSTIPQPAIASLREAHDAAAEPTRGTARPLR